MTFGLAVVFSIARPVWAICFIIVFDLYWLFRIVYLLFHILVSWRRYRRTIRVNWYEKLRAEQVGAYRDYWHLVILPTYREPYQVIQRSLRGIADSQYPKDRLLVVVAGEERDEKNFRHIVQSAEAEFFGTFYRLLFTTHPDKIPGELAGKGSNLHYAGNQAQRLIDELGIPYRQVIVSSFDVDTRPHAQYFALITWTYLQQPDPTRASYQPIAVYNNNVWESNPIVRVVAGSTTFWLLTDLARPERLFTFSSHSISFTALVAVGFWDPTIVTEDSRIFLQCLVHYAGDYRVVPIYLPVYMNTVEIGNFWRSLKSQYRQIRRWAWGVEHFPWMVQNFWGQGNSTRFPLRQKLRYLWNQTEGTYSWATAPLIILFVGRLPLWFSHAALRESSLFLNTPESLSLLMRLGMLGLVVIAVLYAQILPAPTSRRSVFDLLLMVLQWILIPFTLIVFGSIPAVEAQTRLMLGGRFRLGFDVTEKK